MSRSFTDKYADYFRRLLPTPFTIALLLTLLTVVIALIWGGDDTGALDILDFWSAGLWDKGLMVFAMQMMLMLVLGHVLALTPPVNRIIGLAVKGCRNTATSAALVTLLTVAVSLFNWGLGLIFGAIFARKVAEHAMREGISLNYPLIGAAGYSGLMVWHGGISGSALVKVAEKDHLKEMMGGLLSEQELTTLPAQIGFEQTVFSPMNLLVTALLMLLLPLSMYWMGKRVGARPIRLKLKDKIREETTDEIKGAERLDRSRWLPWLFGGIMLVLALRSGWAAISGGSLSFITPNFINFLLLALGLLLHGSIHRFLGAVDDAISGASGILIQFPLYFGIMGIMKNSGLIGELSAFFVEISNEVTYPLFTFMSAGLVNVFVPSGGGQWAVQGPILIQAAIALKVSLSKCIMALAYGDQLTNMLQPFWALPLLGITGLKAKDILPYTLFLMVIGAVIYCTALLLF